MRKQLLRIVLLLSMLPSVNVWAVAIYCSDAQVAGIGTMVNDIYMDASDWSMGTLDPAVTFQGPNSGNIQIFSSYLDLSAFPSYQRYAFSTPHYGTNWSYGEGSTGWLIPGPEGGYVVGDKPTPCSHPKYFPEPVIEVFTISPSTVIEGDTVNVTWSTSGDVFASNGCVVDGTTYASSGSINIVATLGLNGLHSMVCQNNYGYSAAVNRYLTVQEFEPYITILEIGALSGASAVYNEGLRYIQEDASCQEIYDATEYPLGNCASNIATARSVAGVLYHENLYNPHQQYILSQGVSHYLYQVITFPFSIVSTKERYINAMFDFTEYLIEWTYDAI